jgi:hypothetical protein
MKMKPLILFSCLFFLNSASADEIVASTTSSQPAMQSQPQPTSDQVPSPTMRRKNMRKSPYMFTVMGEYLYLQAKEEGLEYGLPDSTPSTDPIPTHGVTGRIHRIEPKFHSGYRVGAGYLLPHRKGLFSAKWMHYGGSHDDHAKELSGEGIWPFWLDQSSAPSAGKAHARWHLDMNVFDLQIGTPFRVKNFLTLQPFAGFRAAWIEQDLDVHYSNIRFVEGVTTPFIDSDNDLHFHGYGICGGLLTKWKIWRGFSFFANGSASLLWSRFKVSQKETIVDGSVRSHIRDRLFTTTPVFELMAGLAWEYEWKSVGLELHFGWEEQIWLHQNMLSRYIDSFAHGTTMTANGNLSLAGYNARASLRF